MTLEDGELITLAYSMARLNTPSGAPLQRKVWISIRSSSRASQEELGDAMISEIVGSDVEIQV